MQGMPSMRERIDAGRARALHGADAGPHRRHPDDWRRPRGSTRCTSTSSTPPPRSRRRRCSARARSGRDHAARAGARRTTTSTSPASLDIGAMGVIVPARRHRAPRPSAIADACRFPPRGHRSVVGPEPGQPLPADAATRAARRLRRADRRGGDAGDARRRSRDADAIAAVPGVDMVMLGPHDLTAEMGILGQFRDEAFLDAVRTVAKACRTHDTDLRHRRHPRPRAAHRVRRARACASSSAGTDVGFMTEAASAHATRLRAIPVGGRS